MWPFTSAKSTMVEPAKALPGRDRPIMTPGVHTIKGLPIDSSPPGTETILLGMGCFWGAERKFWKLPGVVVTAVGYAGGFTKNPTYEEVCSGKTGHTEVVRVVYAPEALPAVLAAFWESHDPTQGMRQGNDTGTQYRSAIYASTPRQLELAHKTAADYAKRLATAGFGAVTTEIGAARDFYYAEDYHQQYLDKNPGGYCGIGGTGVSCQIGVDLT